MRSVQKGLMAAGVGMAVNIVLAIVKIVTGVLGNSYALIADGIESSTDIISSLVVWTGLKISTIPPDDDHPYGHGKAESISAIIVALALFAAAAFIAVESIRELHAPRHTPAWFTLVVLALVVAIKETLFRFVSRVGHQLNSTAVQSDAWHHRADASTSAAAFIGISIALIGGKGYELGSPVRLRRHSVQRLSHPPRGGKRHHGHRGARPAAKGNPGHLGFRARRRAH